MESAVSLCCLEPVTNVAVNGRTFRYDLKSKAEARNTGVLLVSRDGLRCALHEVELLHCQYMAWILFRDSVCADFVAVPREDWHAGQEASARL